MRSLGLTKEQMLKRKADRQRAKKAALRTAETESEKEKRLANFREYHEAWRRTKGIGPITPAASREVRKHKHDLANEAWRRSKGMTERTMMAQLSEFDQQARIKEWNRKAYQNKTPEQKADLCKRSKQWCKVNPEAAKEMRRKSKHKRRARLAGNSAPGVTSQQWSEILELFDHKCAYCLEPATHCDHIIPIAKGGSDSADNVAPACARCNKSKGAKSLPIWLLTTKISQQALTHQAAA